MRISAMLAITYATVLPATLPAQGVPRTVLSEPDAVLAEPFSYVSGLSELSDGRVLVSDRIELAVRRVDFASGQIDLLGHEGRGPGEYQMPGALFPLPGDSSLLVDLGNMRLTVIAPDGTLSGSQPLMRPDGLFIFPRGVDAEGRLYLEMSNFQLAPGQQIPDSFAIARYHPSTDAVDTVGFVPRPQMGQMRSGGGGVSFSGLEPFQATDAWGVAPDGRVAIARPEPYHVEWLSLTGEGAVGPDLVYGPVRVTSADKEAWADEISGGAVAAIGRSSSGGGGRAMNLPRPDIDETEFPEYKPAFPRNAVSVTPEGEAWVKRYVAHGEPETFDVFDAAGRRIRQVVLPQNRRLVGFGQGTLYAVSVDANDLQWLERYRR
ncbi:MAG TPA: hypothetical protein VLC48_02995 [Gemmatimonadota bacterium]|nr:hypothetical protein [Gemmatimonadota bacterium]